MSIIIRNNYEYLWWLGREDSEWELAQRVRFYSLHVDE